MIRVELERDSAGRIRAFTARNHGASHVCAAVSLMVLNTVNSIEALTEQEFSCDYDPKGGYLRYQSTKATGATGATGAEAALLLDAMVLGLEAVRDQYQDENEEVTICYR